MEYVTLSNGVKMPMVGYGVYQVTPDECERCVQDALKVGYRSLDTAQSYYNEEQVGNAIQKSGVPRQEIFLTTKVWVEHYGYDAARASVLESMEKLQTDYLDLVLLHQPFADYYGSQRFIHVMPYGQLPEDGTMDANSLAGTNDLEIYIVGTAEQIVLISRFDNLGKGASGAAVQCMNLMLGLPEDTGL